MSMSDHERSLMVTGTLDTSGVGGSPYAELDQVAVAFGAEVFEGDHIPQEKVEVTVKETPEPEPKATENGPSEQVKESETAAEPATAPRPTKRAPAKKAQAPASAEK